MAPTFGVQPSGRPSFHLEKSPSARRPSPPRAGAAGGAGAGGGAGGGGGGRGEAWIFLSRTGTLEVRRLALEVLRPEDSYDALVRNMGRYYSHLASKGIDW